MQLHLKPTRMGMNFKLTEEQQNAFDKITEFLNGDVPIFILKGYAGTGKTTLLTKVVEAAKEKYGENVKLMAPTGRAAHVLWEKTGEVATTIHRGIYDFDKVVTTEENDEEEENGDAKFRFKVKDHTNQVIAIIDEASMISSKVQESEIFSFGTNNLLEDLVGYVAPKGSGKILFCGDPAQLPPVGDTQSCALEASYFNALGLKTAEAELTQTVRQGGDSLILRNALQIRALLGEDIEKRNTLVFEEKDGEVESLAQDEAIGKYTQTDKNAGDGKNSVIIAYSNHKVNDYNSEIRENLYGKDAPTLIAGEPLMVAKNNYLCDLMNGEFVKVVDLGKVEHQSAPVYIREGKEKKREIITITFQDAHISNGAGDVIACKLILDTLYSQNSALPMSYQKALYINFNMRHPELKEAKRKANAEKDEKKQGEQKRQYHKLLVKTMREDPYYNGLQVKYGYAVTGHKCQGGEWDTALVDYEGRTGLSNDCLRWNYTATTRAKKRLYTINLPKITPFANFKIMGITPIKKVAEEFRAFGKIDHSPYYNDDDEAYLRAKCQCITENLASTPYSIKEIQHKPYREIYIISTPEGSDERYDLIYTGSGVFTQVVPNGQYEDSAEIIGLLNDEHELPIEYDYAPTDEVHSRLYTRVKSACDDLGIQITNVVEHPKEYYTMFYFSTSGTTSYLQVFNNKRGFITYAKSASFVGAKDQELEKLIEILNH